jgi:iron complex outermembrane receptor protein
VSVRLNQSRDKLAIAVAAMISYGLVDVVSAEPVDAPQISTNPNTGGESAVPGQNSGSLEEVIVTARRRSEDVQTVPISISVLSAADLEIRGITTSEGLNHQIINFAPAPSNFFGLEQASFRIRGLPNVGVYVDGIAYQEEFGFLGDLVETDRIEVLRGPQGTLFGKNSLAGAIQYVTTLPSDTFGARVKMTAGDYHRFDVTSSVDIPVTSDLLTKFTVAHTSRNGYLPSVTVNQQYGSEDDLVARADILWKPTSRFDWRFIIEQNDIGTNGNATTVWGLNPTCAPNPAAGGHTNLTCLYNGIGLTINQGYVFGASSTYKTASNYQGPELHTDALNYKTILNYQFADNWAFKGLASYRDVKSESFEDFASIGYDMFEGENNNLIYESTGEAQLNFSSDRLTGTTGVYDYRDYRRYRRENWFSNELKASVDPANNAAVKAFLGIPPFVQIENFAPADPDQLTYYKIHGWAAFTEWTFKATDKLSLTAGVRYNRDTTVVTAYKPLYPIPDVCCVPTTSVSPDGSGPLGPVVSGVFTNTAPRLSAQYQWTPALMTYFTYSEGFNQGGGTQVTNNGVNGVVAYSPETLKNFETGVRSDLFNNRLRLNASIFYSRYDNVQVTEDINFNSVTANAGKGRALGGEIEGQWLISRMFKLNYGIGYLDTELTQVPATSGITPGAVFPFAPKYSVTVGGQFDAPLPNGAGITLRLDEGYTGGVNTGVDSSSVYIGAYGLLSARAIYTPAGEHWDAQLYGTNLTDKFYRLNGYNIAALDMNTGATGIPFMWGITVNYKFQ